MGRPNSKQKGKRGELEAAKALRDLGFEGARRGQQFKGGPESPDVVDAIPGVHIEVKRTERLHLEDALTQSVQEAGPVDVPIVMHRKNRGEWIVIVHLADLRQFAKRVLGEDVT